MRPPDRVHPVRAGETFSAGGFDVAALGEWHALVHQDVPRIHNVGYLVEGVLHPGDAFIDPAGAQVDVLCTPLGAPWLKLGEVVDYVRSVGPGRIVVVHDALLSAIGQGMAIGAARPAGRRGGARSRSTPARASTSEAARLSQHPHRPYGGRVGRRPL